LYFPDENSNSLFRPSLFASEKLNNRFQNLLPCLRNPITRSLDHRLYYGAFTLTGQINLLKW